MTSTKKATPEELELLYRALALQTDERLIAALLEDMCTIREIDEMAQRLTVAKLLAADLPYIAISDITGASATTIARVSKSLNYGAGGYRSVLDLEDAASSKSGTSASQTPNKDASASQTPNKDASASHTGSTTI